MKLLFIFKNPNQSWQSALKCLVETTDHSKASCYFTSFYICGHITCTLCVLTNDTFITARVEIGSSVSVVTDLPPWFEETALLLFISLTITYRKQTAVIVECHE